MCGIQGERWGIAYDPLSEIKSHILGKSLLKCGGCSWACVMPRQLRLMFRWLSWLADIWLPHRHDILRLQCPRRIFFFLLCLHPVCQQWNGSRCSFGCIPQSRTCRFWPVPKITRENRQTFRLPVEVFHWFIDLPSYVVFDCHDDFSSFPLLFRCQS